jgi:hypothetical protein
MRASNHLKWCLRVLSILAILSLLPWAQLGAAQELPPPEIVGLEPSEGWPGEQVQTAVWGDGFDEEVEVIIDGLETEVIRRSAERLVVQIFIPGDAPPGPRDVIVINHVGPAREDRLPGGFVVLGERDREAPVKVELEAVEPSQGDPGQRLDVTLWGEGFGPEMEVNFGDGVIEEGRELVDDSTMRLQIAILDDAPPGPRDVEVFNPEAQSGDVLRQGFTVQGREGPGPVRQPTPTEPPGAGNGGIPWGIAGLLLGLLALVATPVAAYLTWDAVRRRRLTRQRQELERWQEEAQHELPRECRLGAKLPIIGRKVESGTWEIVHLVFIPESRGADRTPDEDQHRVGGKIVRRLNEVVALRKRTHDENRLRRMVSPLAQELARLLWVWARQRSPSCPIAVQANAEGKVTYQFKLYECQKTDGANRWQEIKDWEGTVKETQELLVGHLVGPQEREGKGRFQKRAVEVLVPHLLELTSKVSSIE